MKLRHVIQILFGVLAMILTYGWDNIPLMLLTIIIINAIGVCLSIALAALE